MKKILTGNKKKYYNIVLKYIVSMILFYIIFSKFSFKKTVSFLNNIKQT